MKLSSFFTLALASVVFALPTDTAGAGQLETNAQRFARGMPPAKPRNLFSSRTNAAHEARHSIMPGSCPSGYTKLCCLTVADTHNPLVKIELEILGLILPEIEDVALTCNLYDGQCHKTTTCCKETYHNFWTGVKCRDPY